MTNFMRALSAETLKLRRTMAWKLVWIAPLAVVLLTLFMASQAPFTTLRRGSAIAEPWKALLRVNLQFWGLLMLPLFVTIETALIAGLDHAENQWKALFARPVARWNVYVAKLAVVVAMAAAGGGLLALGVIGEGLLLHWYDAQLGFGKDGVPAGLILMQVARMTALGLLFLTIQHWVSLRWRSFAMAVGVGAVAIVIGFGMLLAAGQYGAWPQYFPWALPMLVVARQQVDLALVMGIAGGLAVVAGALGCADFCRREVH